MTDVQWLYACVWALLVWGMWLAVKLAGASSGAQRANDRITENENARDVAEKFHGSVVRWGELKDHEAARERALQKLAMENKAALERDPVVTESRLKVFAVDRIERAVLAAIAELEKTRRADHDLLAGKIKTLDEHLVRMNQFRLDSTEAMTRLHEEASARLRKIEVTLYGNPLAHPTEALVNRVAGAENDIMWIEERLESQGWTFAQAEQPRWTKAKK